MSLLLLPVLKVYFGLPLQQYLDHLDMAIANSTLFSVLDQNLEGEMSLREVVSVQNHLIYLVQTLDPRSTDIEWISHLH